MEFRAYARVSNLRLHSSCRIKADELSIRVDRRNKILGNTHHMLDDSDAERSRVIFEFQQDLEDDLVVQGPMYQELWNIANLAVRTGRKIALECWCAPKPCHADLLLKVILEMIEKIIASNEASQVS